MRPQGIPDDYGRCSQTMFEMMKLAWQANMTRCATFMMAREVTMRTFPNLSISDAWHPLSHHHNDPDNLAKLTRIQHFMTQSFAGFIKTLAETQDGDGTLLDHAIVLYGSDMANSDMHNHTPLPQVLLGHGCGTIKGGQHLAYPAGYGAREPVAHDASSSGSSREVARRQHRRVGADLRGPACVAPLIAVARSPDGQHGPGHCLCG